MSGKITNARKGGSEATRYIYLNFGTRGITFMATADTPPFVDLKAPTPAKVPTRVKLTDQTGVQNPQTFFDGDTTTNDLQASLCFPTGRSRYWYSGKASTDPHIAMIVSSNIRDRFFGDARLTTDALYLDGELVVSYFGLVIISAAVFNDPTEGECLFYVGCGYLRNATTYNDTHSTSYPLRGVVQRVKDKALVRSWVVTAVSLGLPATFPGYLGTLCKAWGSHSLDGLTFYHTAWGQLNGKDIVNRVTIDSYGTITPVSSLVGTPDYTTKRVVDVSQSDTRTPVVITSTTGSPPYNYTQTTANSGSFSGSSEDKIVGTLNQSSDGVFCEEDHDGNLVVFTLRHTRDYLFSVKDVMTMASPHSGFVSGTASPDLLSSTGASDSNDSWAIEASSTTIESDTHQAVLTLWDGVEVFLKKFSRELISSGSGKDIGSRHETTTGHSTRDAGGNLVSSHFFQQVDYNRVQYSDHSYNRTITGESRTLMAFCTQSKSALFFVRGSSSVSSESASYTHTSQGSPTLTIGLNQIEVRAGSVDLTRDDKPGTYNQVDTGATWMELVVGGVVTVFNKVDDTTLTINRPQPSDPAFPRGEWYKGNPTHYESPVSHEPTILSQLLPFDAHPGDGYKYHTHMVGLGDTSLVVVPESFVLGGGGNEFDRAHPTGYKIAVTPEPAMNASATELSSSLSDVKFFYNVYPSI